MAEAADFDPVGGVHAQGLLGLVIGQTAGVGQLRQEHKDRGAQGERARQGQSKQSPQGTAQPTGGATALGRRIGHTARPAPAGAIKSASGHYGRMPGRLCKEM